MNIDEVIGTPVKFGQYERNASLTFSVSALTDNIMTCNTKEVIKPQRLCFKNTKTLHYNLFDYKGEDLNNQLNNDEDFWILTLRKVFKETKTKE